jgi:cytochrome c oxidase subunit 2
MVRPARVHCALDAQTLAATGNAGDHLTREQRLLPLLRMRFRATGSCVLGISPVQSPSALAPASAQAAALHEVTLVLIAGAALIFAGTMALLALALWRRRRPAVSTPWWVVGGGIVFPVVVLSATLLYSTARTAGLERTLAQPPLVISVTGRMWWWEVRYRDPASGRDIVLANELRMPAGRATQVALLSDDVIHSFWVPELGGKRDLVPGRVNHLVITPERTGTFRGQCAEYCGEQHARMALHVIALPPAEFDRWLAGQALPSTPANPALERGRRAFAEHGCAACHTVRGAFEGGRLGPDLTHVAGRTALGAGVLANEPGAARRWLVGVQELKPGARMPSYAHLDAATLDALAAYLET